MSDHQPPATRQPHRWRPGMPSPNPKGRPRTGTAFAEAVRERVDPHELIRIALDIARGLPAVRDLTHLRARAEAEAKGEPPPPIEGVEVVWPTQSERLAALTFLRDSGYQKPAQQLEVGALGASETRDLTKLTDAELAQLEKLQAKALGILDVDEPTPAVAGALTEQASAR